MPKLSTRPNRFYPSIPGVTEDQSTHTNALQQIRESIETHERRNSNYLKSFIRFEELVELGIIDETGEFILDTGGDSGTGVNVLDDLEDVTTGGPADNDILGYDFATGQWTAQNAAELNLATLDDLSGVSGVQYLADLLDVDVTGGSQYDLLYLNGLWRPTNGVMQWSGTDLHIDGGGVYFAQVGQTQNAYVAANVSAVGNLDLQALGDVFLTPDRDVRVDEADVVLDINQGIRFVHSDLAKRYHLELAGGPLEGVTPDPDIGSVTFLAGFEGATAGAETFTADIDTNNVGAITWAITSGTQPTQVDAEISTVQAKYGTQSIYAKESVGAANAAWSSGSIPGSYFSFTGDFTIECDIYIVDGTSEIPICGSWVFGEYQWKWTLEGGNQRMGFLFGLTDTTSAFGGSQETWGGGINGVPTGAWHHIAVCRSGDQWYFWLDGALSDGGANTNANAINIPTTTNFNIMADGPAIGANQIEAYMDNLRITDGVARYTTAFTPPTGAHDDGSTGVETRPCLPDTH
jgi:hypothetical protein